LDSSSASQEKIPVALIDPPSRGAELIFGRPLLERTIRVCERAGIGRFLLRCPAQEQPKFNAALGRFAGDPRVRFVESFGEMKNDLNGDHRPDQCVALKGNIVFSLSQLRELMAQQAAGAGGVVKLPSSDGDPAASVSVGSPNDLLNANGQQSGVSVSSRIIGLPFALNGRPEDREAAERVIASTLRHDTAHTDGVMARLFDRKISWRLSYRLARTAIMPNQVTLANTALGFVIAWMFAQPNYWIPLLASILFVVSITIDGVDGELARLKMAETKAGARLDAITDNIVHIAIFLGIGIGSYRAAHNPAYVYVLLAFLIGFGCCAISVHRAMSLSAAGAEAFIRKVDRLTGRDFAYLVFLLALINRLNYFIIGAAVGTYLFAGGLWWLTNKWTQENAAQLTGGDRLAEGI
jgi:phosphatidylglycerophosphate synthase